VTTPPQQTYLARTFEDDRYAWTRTRRVRRRLVVAEATLLITLMVAALVAALADVGWTTAYLAAWAVGLFGFVPLHSSLNLGIRGLFDRSGRSLDEHQRRLREQSLGAVGAPSIALHLAAWFGGILLATGTGHPDLALAMAFLLWFIAWLLSYWHLAWTMPDEDHATDEDA
jgi:membrane protein implicated in regulation of membrane protease activity